MVRAELKASDMPNTRDRILEAAQRRFSAASYEQVGLRNIAEDVGIDVAYVHRTFGSKDKLFTEVLRLSFIEERDVPVASPGLPDRLIEDMFRTLDTRNAGIDPLSIVVHSLSSATAGSILRQFIIDEFTAPMSDSIKGDGAQRAALLASLLLGIRILRDVIGLQALDKTHRNILEPLARQMITAGLGPNLETENNYTDDR